MGYDEPERESNLEVEVSPLHRTTSSAPAPTDTATESSPLLAPRRARREHLLRGAVVTAGLVVILVALVLSIAPTREALYGLVSGPTPTTTDPISAGEDSLYITINPTWGAVALDNRTLGRLPLEGVDQPLWLSRGRHTIRWQFAPIIDYTCHLTVPSAPGDNCPTRTGIQPGKKGIASVVTLQLELPNLAPAYRHSLLVAIQTAFDAQQSADTVRPGEVYRSDDAALGYPVVVAKQSLRATLRFVSDAENHDVNCPAITSDPGSGCMMNGDCRELCAAPWQDSLPAAVGAYNAYIVAHPTWRYTSFDGRVLADNAPDFDVQRAAQSTGAAWYEPIDELPVPITISWEGSAWKVSASVGVRSPFSSLPDITCVSAWAEIQFGFLSPPTSAGWQAVTPTSIPGNPVAEGCLLALTAPGLNPLFLLHRFGVMLAVNDAVEHSLGHNLPMADAYERAIAQTLARQNHFESLAP